MSLEREVELNAFALIANDRQGKTLAKPPIYSQLLALFLDSEYFILLAYQLVSSIVNPRGRDRIFNRGGEGVTG